MFDVIELPPVPTSVATARKWSGEVIERVGAGQLADTIALLVSELVSNAVLHAQTVCWLRIASVPGRVRVEVEDQSNELPGDVSMPGPLATSGRGLALVDSLSVEYGVVTVAPSGKRIWFELETNGF